MPKKKDITETALGFWGAVGIIWALVKYYLNQPDFFYFSELIIKPIVFIGTTYSFIKLVEKSRFFKKLFPHKNIDQIIKPALIILLFSFILFVFKQQTLDIKTILLINLTNLATAFSEDILIFGLILRVHLQKEKSIFYPVVLTGLLYTLLRIPSIFVIQELQGSEVITVLLSGFFLIIGLGIIYTRKRNLLNIITLHFIYLTLITLFAF